MRQVDIEPHLKEVRELQCKFQIRIAVEELGSHGFRFVCREQDLCAGVVDLELK